MASCARSVTVRKSVLLSLIFIGGILGLVGFSMASFIDQETQVAQITAGTLDLEPDADNVTCELAITSGGTDDCEFTYVNEGSLTGSLWALGYIQSYACTDTTYGANDESEYCDSSADIGYENLQYCGSLGSVSEACPATATDLLDFLNDYYCVQVSTSLAPDAEVDGSFTFKMGTLTNVQQGDALVVRWQLFFTDSTSSTAPTECTTFPLPPSI
jgi:hypothetical protein